MSGRWRSWVSRLGTKCDAGIQSGSGDIKKIGILGGTFDPVHNGHLAIAEEARRQLGLDEVLFIPAGQPWMKSDRIITPIGIRVAMVRAAIKGKHFFKMSLAETKTGYPSYTVETLEKLRKKFGKQAQFYFIMGSDSLPDFQRWKEPGKILEMTILLVLPRPGVQRLDLKTLEMKVPGITKRVTLLAMRPVDISASEIREKVRQGKPITGQVPEAVEKYIRHKRLYTD